MAPVSVFFILLMCMPSVLGNTLEKVPDNKVWTPDSATFFYGQPRANITCKFVGKPYGVYWMKGRDSSTAETLISKIRGTVSGPRYDDGSLSITEDYALVFNNVQAGDEGKYICRVSNHNGFLIVNDTNVKVLDPNQVAIYTEPSVKGLAKFSVHLECAFLGDPERVLWNLMQGEGDGRTIATVLRYSSGSYEVLGDRRYTWSHSYGLIINDLKVIDEGNFTCDVLKSGGTKIQNSTALTVNAYAEEPYPRIDQCISEPKLKNSSSTQRHCVYNVSRDQDSFELQCSVKHVKPVVDVVWQEWSTNIPASSAVSLRDDGAFDVTSTLRRKLNESTFDFTCITTGEAVNGSAKWSVRVNRVSKGPGSGRIHDGAISIIFFIVAIASTILVITCILLYLKRYKPKIYSDFLQRLPCGRTFLYDAEEAKDLRSNEERELERLREELKAYTPGKRTESNLHLSEVTAGLFGVMKCGKSSFINSLYFALTNDYKNIAIESGSTASGSETQYRERVRLTNSIHIIDSRGMRDFDLGEIRNLIQQIMDRSERKRIHCPIFVCDLSSSVTRGETFKFVHKFAQEVQEKLGHYPMVVVTHAKKLENSTEADGTLDDVKKSITDMTRVPAHHIWMFENYTETSHDHDAEKSIKYLQFLLKCLDVAEANITFRQERDEERNGNPIRRIRGFFRRHILREP